MRLQEYKDQTDEELIRQIRVGDRTAGDVLMERYKGMVLGKARSMYMLGGDSDDLIQEGMIGLYKAVRDFDTSKEASFKTFASLCVSRQLYTAVRASMRNKHLPLNTAISLDSPSDTGQQSEENGQTTDLVNMIASDPEFNPEDSLIESENLSILQWKIEQKLSPLEKQVLELYLSGLSYTQIAQQLSIDPKAADNALQRIRTKLRREIGGGR